MASYALEDFVGDGVLKDLLGQLTADGWDDVPTLKMMNAEDMEALQLTEQQRDALEIRTYLHDRSLMEYADKLEASGKNLPELLIASPSSLSAQYGMKRGHVAKFIDRSSACGIQMPPTLSLPARKRTMASRSEFSVDEGSEYSSAGIKSGLKGTTTRSSNGPLSPDRLSNSSGFSQAQSEAYESSTKRGETGGFNSMKDDSPGFKPPIVVKPAGTNNPNASKGLFSAAPPTSRLCGLVMPHDGVEDVTPLSVLEKIYVQKLTPEYKNGVDPWATDDLKMPPPSKASELWVTKPTLLFCIRRPGCVMCRAEAHQLYARKPIFDAMGIQLVAVLNEHIDSEVKAFWPRYWGGMVVVDKSREFYRALGGGQLLKENLITGFIFNPLARQNWKRARASGIENNLHGEATIKGGLYIVRPGKGGVAYQFVERNFGDWAPLEEVLEVCTNLKVSLSPES